MWDLIRIVLPKVKAEWEYLAYSMEYNIATIEEIEKDNSNSEGCCVALFADWLHTDHGAIPKTWSTLLQRIKGVDSLAAAVDDIKRQLSGMTQSYTVILYYMHVYIVGYYFLVAILLGSWLVCCIYTN